MDNKDEELRARHLSALHAFILRARRVEQHSLVQNPETLPKLAQGHGAVQLHEPSGDTYFVQELPPEEVVESAAARVRPLILENDPTFHSKFLQAIGYFIKMADAGDEAEKVYRDLKGGWNTIKPKGRDATGYYLQVSTAGSSQSEQVTDNVLGFAWIYGDVIHNDVDRLGETRSFGVTERYRAAVPLVARIMILAINTLWVVRALQKGGVVPQTPEAHEAKVTVDDTTFRQKGQIYVSEPLADGAVPDVPPIGAPLGAEWQPFRQVFRPTEPGDTSPRGEA